MKKILLILRSLPYPISKDGISVINYRLLYSIPDCYTVDIISLSKELDETIINIKRLRSVNNIYTYEDNGIDCEYIRKRILIKRFIGIETSSYKTFVDKHIKNYDLIYYCTPPSALYCYIPKTNTPIYLNAVDSFSLLNERLYKLNRNIISKVKWKLYKYLERKIFKKADLVNFVSSVDEKYTNTKLESYNTSSIPNGVEIQNWTNSEREDNILLFVGNFDNISNLLSLRHFINNIWPEIKDNHKSIKLYIVGPNLKDVYDDPAIVKLGYVDDVGDYYRKCTIFIAPLISGSGIKNKVLEAMSYGIPVISSKIGLDGIDVQENTHVLKAETITDWKNSINKLLQDKQFREHIAKNAFSLVGDKYDWDRNIKLYYDNMANLIKANITK